MLLADDRLLNFIAQNGKMKHFQNLDKTWQAILRTKVGFIMHVTIPEAGQSQIITASAPGLQCKGR